MAIAVKHKAQAIGDDIKDKVEELEAKADAKKEAKEARELAEKRAACYENAECNDASQKPLPAVGASAHRLATPTSRKLKSDSTRTNPSSPSSVSSVSSVSSKSSNQNFSQSCEKDPAACKPQTASQYKPSFHAGTPLKPDFKPDTSFKAKSSSQQRPLALADVAPAAAEKSKEFRWNPNPRTSTNEYKSPFSFSAAPAGNLDRQNDSLTRSSAIPSSARQAPEAFNVKTTTTVTSKPASPRTLAAFSKCSTKQEEHQQTMAEARSAAKAAHPGVISLADVGKEAAKMSSKFKYKASPRRAPDFKGTITYQAMPSKPMGKPHRMPSLKEEKKNVIPHPQPGFAHPNDAKSATLGNAKSSSSAGFKPQTTSIIDSKTPVNARAKSNQVFTASPTDALTKIETTTKRTYLHTDERPTLGSSSKLHPARGDTPLRSPHYSATTDTHFMNHGSHHVGHEMGKAAHEMKQGTINAAKTAGHVGKGAAAAAVGAFDVAADGAKVVAHGAEVAGVKAIHGAHAAAKVLGTQAAIAGDVVADESKHFFKGAKKVLGVAGKKTGSIAADTAVGIAGVTSKIVSGAEKMADNVGSWFNGLKHDISANAKAHKLKARESKTAKRALAATAKPAMTTKTITTQAKPVKQAVTVQAKPVKQAVAVQAKPVTVQAKSEITQPATQVQPRVIQTQPIVVETKPSVAVQSKPPTTTTTTTTYKTITEEKKTPVVEAKPVQQKPLTTYVQVPVTVQPAPVQVIEQPAPQPVTTTRVVEQKAPVASQAKRITVPVTQNLVPTTQVTAEAPRLYAVAPKHSDKKGLRKLFGKSHKYNPDVQVTRTVDSLQHHKFRPIEQDSKYVTMSQAKDLMKGSERAFKTPHRSWLSKLGFRR